MTSAPAATAGGLRVATDVGGTYTDLVVFDPRSGMVRAVKTDTVYPHFDEGVMRALALADIAPSSVDFLAHGSTVVINTLLSRTGARTGLITTQGFRDVLEIARGNRPDLFNFLFSKPVALVPRYLRLEADERIDAYGEVVTPLDLDSVDRAVHTLKAEGVTTIAVAFLHSWRNPAHEVATLQRIRALWPEVEVVASHQICREWREYERTSTTVACAYVKPATANYLGRLERAVEQRGYHARPWIMQSNGGMASIPASTRNPIAMVESGPASGMLAAATLGRQLGIPDLIALDIGGTTAKCALVTQGALKTTTEYSIEHSRTNPGHPIRTAVIDLVEIGNGGGSIAWVDEGDRLHVGPKSAGSTPGPVAYGRGGTEPTTTDANLYTGRINPSRFAGGKGPDMAALQQSLLRLGARLGQSPQAVARGILNIANHNMVNALKQVSLNRGHDPRELTLVVFGGGGALHAAHLAVELGVKEIVIPAFSSVFSAWGMLVTDLRQDHAQTHFDRLNDASLAELSTKMDAMEAQAREDMLAEGGADMAVVIERHADMRYAGQEHTVQVTLAAGLTMQEVAQRFEQAHERAYGFALTSAVEVVALRVVAWGQLDKPVFRPLERAETTQADVALSGRREVDFDRQGGVCEAAVYDRDRLLAGMTIEGPAIVEEASASTVVLPGQTAWLDDWGHLHVRVRPDNDNTGE